MGGKTIGGSNLVGYRLKVGAAHAVKTASARRLKGWGGRADSNFVDQQMEGA